MNLFILRHGIAAEPGVETSMKDADRPLTAKGERKIWKIAEAMEALGLCFDLILSSPYVRARDTAKIVADAFNARKKLEFTDNLTPNGSSQKLIQALLDRDPAPQDVLLVGHEPYLSELISLLVSGEKNLAITLKKGGLCKLAAESLRHSQCASLEWLLTPKQMGLMA